MFRILPGIQKFLALVLPALLVCSCMACVSICSNLTEQSENEKGICIKVYESEIDRGKMSGISESCPLTVTPVTFQERQIIHAPALVDPDGNYLSLRILKFVPSAVRDSKINPPSPPRLTSRLYLHLQNFRI